MRISSWTSGDVIEGEDIVVDEDIIEDEEIDEDMEAWSWFQIETVQFLFFLFKKQNHYSGMGIGKL
jgi:hypothetical protein